MQQPIEYFLHFLTLMLVTLVLQGRLHKANFRSEEKKGEYCRMRAIWAERKTINMCYKMIIPFHEIEAE